MTRQIYTLLLYLSLPLVFLRLLVRSVRAPAYRNRWGERLGRFVPPQSRGGVWIHAVSVGEAQAIAPLIRHLLCEYPGLPITVTTTTPTGSDRVTALFADEVFHVYFPYDLPCAVQGFLDRIQPCLLVLVETEVWPNLLFECAPRKIPTLLANGRLSARSARGYARLGRFARETFARIGFVAAQADTDAERFIALGIPRERVRVTGSIKFDVRVAASVREHVQVVRRTWGSHRPVWVAASTHEGEDEQVLDAHETILRQIENALLVLVPRHPERFERVAALCVNRGFVVARRSKPEKLGPEVSVLVGDTMGELVALLGAADAAFIGGSLVPSGGHNMLEAAAQGLPVAFGPHVFNFASVSNLLLDQQAAVQIEDADGLAQLMISWLTDASERSRIGLAGQEVVEQNRGALDALTEMIKTLLAGSPHIPFGYAPSRNQH